MCYEHGYGVRRDVRKAAVIYRKAMRLGNAWACSNLGELYASGKGVKRNAARAMKLFQKGAARGSANACANIGEMYRTGFGVQTNLVEAQKWLRKAIDLGSSEACRRLAELVESNPEMQKSRDEVKALRERAAKLDEEPTDEVSHEDGFHEHVAPDVDVDVDSLNLFFLRKLLDHIRGEVSGEEEGANPSFDQYSGHEDSEEFLDDYQLGRFSSNSLVNEETDPAVKDSMGIEYYERGLQYENGDGVVQDNYKAFEYFRQSASLGNSEACHRLGICYEFGIGTEENSSLADYWYKKSNALHKSEQPESD